MPARRLLNAAPLSPKCRPVVSQMPPRRLPNAGPLSPKCRPVVSQMPARRFPDAGPSFPIVILVNFSTWPKAQIERYYYHDDIIRAF